MTSTGSWRSVNRTSCSTGDGRPDLVARDRATGRTWIYSVRSDGSIGPRFGGWNTWADLDRLTGAGDVARNGTISLAGRTRGRRLVVLPALGTRWLEAAKPTTRTAAGADFMQAAGDWNGDGHVDVITRSAVSGRVLLYPGNGNGGLGARTVMWRTWKDRTDLVVTEDVTGDALPDLYARDPGGLVYVYPSDGTGGKSKRRLAHSNLFATDMIAPAGYWNGDGVRDLIVRHAGNKQLYLVPGKAKGMLGQPVRLTDGFAAYDKLVGAGDFNGDGRPDLLARERRTTHLWLFAGTPAGLKPRHFVATDSARYDLIG